MKSAKEYAEQIGHENIKYLPDLIQEVQEDTAKAQREMCAFQAQAWWSEEAHFGTGTQLGEAIRATRLVTHPATSENEKAAGAWVCNLCGYLAHQEREVSCWDCDDGEMIFVRSIKELNMPQVEQRPTEYICLGSNQPVVVPVVSNTMETWCGVCGVFNHLGGQIMPTHLFGQMPAMRKP